MLKRLEWAVSLAMIAGFLYVAPTLIHLAGAQLAAVGQAISQEVKNIAVGFLAAVSGLGALLWCIEHFFGITHGKEIVKKVLLAAAATFGMPAAVVSLSTLAPHLVDKATTLINHAANAIGV
jgi:hypothetical protein